MAHNGVLHNDDALKQRCHLPKTNGQLCGGTASGAGRTAGRRDHREYCRPAGRFVLLTLLNQFNHLYLVKGNSPLCIYRFENGLICYASTADILKEALARCSFLPRSKEIVSLSEGDILCIRPDGRLQMSRFDTSNLHKHLRWWDCGAYDCRMPQSRRLYRENLRTSLDTLLETACNMGFLEDDVYLLLEEGFDENDIEELLNLPGAFYDTLRKRFTHGWMSKSKKKARRLSFLSRRRFYVDRICPR